MVIWRRAIGFKSHSKELGSDMIRYLSLSRDNLAKESQGGHPGVATRVHPAYCRRYNTIQYNTIHLQYNAIGTPKIEEKMLLLLFTLAYLITHIRLLSKSSDM